MTQEELDEWCSYCGCEGGCHYDCMRNWPEEKQKEFHTGLRKIKAETVKQPKTSIYEHTRRQLV